MTSEVDPDPGADGDVPVEVPPEANAEADPTACAYTEYRSGPDPEALPATGEEAEGVEARVWDALYGVEDPEMPISIVDLGLVYGVAVHDDGGHAGHESATQSGDPVQIDVTDDSEDDKD